MMKAIERSGNGACKVCGGCGGRMHINTNRSHHQHKELVFLFNADFSRVSFCIVSIETTRIMSKFKYFQAHRFKANLVPATSLSPSQTQESPLGGGLWARQQLYGGSIWRISSSVCQHCGLVLCNVA